MTAEVGVAGPEPAAQPSAGSLSLKGYEFTSFWEKAAALDASQVSAISALGESIASARRRDFSTNATATSSVDATKSLQPGDNLHSEQPGDWENQVLQNSHQFYKWYSELTTVRRQQIEGEYGEYLEALSQRLEVTDSVAGRVDRSISALNALQSHCSGVCGKVTQIKKSCERLMHEKEMLVQYADALSARLGCFDELESLGAHFHKLPATAGHAELIPLLNRLDECLTYMSSNPQYMDTMSYTLRLRQLQIETVAAAKRIGGIQGKAISLIHGNVQTLLQQATTTLQTELGVPGVTSPSKATTSSGTGGASTSQGASTPSASGAAPAVSSTLLCVRFRALVETQLTPILVELSQKSAQNEYNRLLRNIEGSFCAERLGLILPFVRHHISSIQSSQDLQNMARYGVAYVLDVCRMELGLAGAFFKQSYHPSAQLDLVEAVCNVLYDSMRPMYIQLQDPADLVGLIDVLKQAVRSDALTHRDLPASAMAERAVSRITQDVQERLIFRSAAFLRDEVQSFKPQAADLDYPQHLINAQQSAGAQAQASETGQNRTEEHPASATNNADTSAVDDTATWYPPLRSTLMCLSKLYNCVDPQAFSGLGQDALYNCTHSIQQAGAMIEKKAGVKDAQLFAIRHLLILREQISFFQVDFRAYDRDLDFTHVRGQMQRLLAGEVPIFQSSQAVASLQNVAKGSLRVQENQVDGKKELEKALKSKCEAFIMTMTKVAVEPMLTFVTKVNALQQVGKAGGPSRKALSKLAFASPSKISSLVEAVNESLKTRFPEAAAKVQLYITKPKTRASLMKPVVSNITEAHDQIRTLLHQIYTAEEAAAVPLLGKEELAQMLSESCDAHSVAATGSQVSMPPSVAGSQQSLPQLPVSQPSPTPPPVE